jgi:hypothetical protein
MPVERTSAAGVPPADHFQAEAAGYLAAIKGESPRLSIDCHDAILGQNSTATA